MPTLYCEWCNAPCPNKGFVKIHQLKHCRAGPSTSTGQRAQLSDVAIAPSTSTTSHSLLEAIQPLTKSCDVATTPPVISIELEWYTPLKADLARAGLLCIDALSYEALWYLGSAYNNGVPVDILNLRRDLLSGLLDISWETDIQCSSAMKRLCKHLAGMGVPVVTSTHARERELWRAFHLHAVGCSSTDIAAALRVLRPLPALVTDKELRYLLEIQGIAIENNTSRDKMLTIRRRLNETSASDAGTRSAEGGSDSNI